MRPTRSLLSRLLSHRAITPDGCWLWTGAADKNGYGRIKDGGRSAYVHRVSYEQHHGAIPPGLVVDHVHDRCPSRSRLCFNPAHLEAITSQANTARGIRAITARRIERMGGDVP